ncbi:unnamed protein product [Psylliodes chrysocephalus]|uniref:C2H2-type domain-containing protein n=1 Tax=Psylliodes chrysocephalus TaxID=3402493 RepID=A0A9P0D8X8_9CUCU|nr:unnamed protein product [Psylliodes chrysocephala]
MNVIYCSICLNSTSCITRFGDLDDNNINWLAKLKSIVPDLQDESEDNLICGTCTDQLDNFLIFKKRIHNLVERLKQTETKQEEDTFFEEKFYSENPSPVTVNEDSNDSKTSKKVLDSLNYVQKESSIKTSRDDLFTCIKCNEDFNSKKELNLHKKVCKQVYSCYTCKKTYNSKAALKIHHKKCCFGENEDQKPKKKGRKSNRSYSCETCDQIFNLVKDLMAHCKSIHGIEERSVKPYSCTQCTQRFRTYAGYDQHIKYHSRSRDNVCSLCGKRFITKSELIVHEYTHFNRRNYKCVLCGKAFNTNKNLKTHILVVHTDRSAWKFSCNVCEKRFPQKGNYDQHMKRHAGDKQHICHICQKPFITSSELKRHVNLHSNVKAFTCEYCQREYKTQRTLKTHLRRSHEIGDKLPEKEKRFVCHICPSQFYDKQKLLRHLYCHSGVKPFQCTACEKKFADKSYLKHHMKVMHNLVMTEDVKYDNISELKYDSTELKYDSTSELKYEVPEHLKFEFGGVK